MQNANPPPPAEQKKVLLEYQLMGVVNHIGSLHGGHYVAYVCRGQGDDKKWFCASDRHVSQVPFSTVRACDAYLLFYTRCSK